MDTVPILAGSNRHAGDGEVFVQLIKGRAAPAAPRAHHARADLHGLVKGRGVKQAVQAGDERRVRGRVIDGARHDEAVRLLKLRLELVDHVVKDALAELATGSAGRAAAHGLIADEHGLDLHAACLEDLLHLTQCDGGVAVCVRAAVEHQYLQIFHCCLLLYPPRAAERLPCSTRTVFYSLVDLAKKPPVVFVRPNPFRPPAVPQLSQRGRIAAKGFHPLRREFIGVHLVRKAQISVAKPLFSAVQAALLPGFAAQAEARSIIEHHVGKAYADHRVEALGMLVLLRVPQLVDKIEHRLVLRRTLQHGRIEKKRFCHRIKRAVGRLVSLRHVPRKYDGQSALCADAFDQRAPFRLSHGVASSRLLLARVP